MKNKYFIVIPVVVVLIVLILCSLPFEITRRTEIKYGNQLIEKIEEYKAQNKEIPFTDDWKTLELLGFQMKDLGSDPSYMRINETEYELIYYKGFDGPFLFWNSETKKWTVGNPKTPDEWNKK